MNNQPAQYDDLNEAYVDSINISIISRIKQLTSKESLKSYGFKLIELIKNIEYKKIGKGIVSTIITVSSITINMLIYGYDPRLVKYLKYFLSKTARFALDSVKSLRVLKTITTQFADFIHKSFEADIPYVRVLMSDHKTYLIGLSRRQKLGCLSDKNMTKMKIGLTSYHVYDADGKICLLDISGDPIPIDQNDERVYHIVGGDKVTNAEQPLLYDINTPGNLVFDAVRVGTPQDYVDNYQEINADQQKRESYNKGFVNAFIGKESKDNEFEKLGHYNATFLITEAYKDIDLYSRSLGVIYGTILGYVFAFGLSKPTDGPDIVSLITNKHKNIAKNEAVKDDRKFHEVSYEIGYKNGVTAGIKMFMKDVNTEKYNSGVEQSVGLDTDMFSHEDIVCSSSYMMNMADRYNRYNEQKINDSDSINSIIRKTLLSYRSYKRSNIVNPLLQKNYPGKVDYTVLPLVKQT